MVCFYPEWDERGVGEGTGRRERVEEGRGEKESEKGQEGKLNLKEKSVELPAVSWPLNKKQS